MELPQSSINIYVIYYISDPLFKESCRGTKICFRGRCSSWVISVPLFKESCRGTAAATNDPFLTGEFQSIIQRVMPCNGNISLHMKKLMKDSVLYSKSHAWNSGVTSLTIGRHFFSVLYSKRSCRGTGVTTPAKFLTQLYISVIYSKSHAVESGDLTLDDNLLNFSPSIQRVMPWNPFSCILHLVSPFISVLYSKSQAVERLIPVQLFPILHHFSPTIQESCRGTMPPASCQGGPYNFSPLFKWVMPWNSLFFKSEIETLTFSPLFKESLPWNCNLTTDTLVGKTYFSPLIKESCRGTQFYSFFYIHKTLISVLYSKESCRGTGHIQIKKQAVEEFQSSNKESCRGTFQKYSDHLSQKLISVLYSKSHAVEPTTATNI